MSIDLGFIIREIVQNQKVERLQQIYIVDRQTGPYRKIQQAIDEALPGSLIKISQGLYDETLVIKKPLTLEPKLYNSPNSKEQKGVILLVSSGHAITVDIAEQESCTVRGFKISHSGNTYIESFENKLLENQEIMKLFERKQGNNYTLETEYVNKVKVENVENIILYARRGKVVLQSCLLSLAYIVKSCKNLIPNVFVDRQAKVLMTKCQIKGNKNHSTVGVLCRLGRVQLKNCHISQSDKGGVIVWSVAGQTSRVMSTVIEECSIGIHLVGQDNCSLVHQNTISKCKTGIKIGIGVKAEISGNVIQENSMGIQIYSAFPLILKNRIQKNEEDGILAKSHKKLRCCATIKSNFSIVGNKQNGIRIQGQNNYTRIIDNHFIAFNGLSGVRVAAQAHPHLLLNKIYKNFGQGILLRQGSSAIIQRNDLQQNVKMNIGFGGQRSNNTVVIENCIKGSRGEGILMVECQRAMICRNDITENNDGVVAITSIPIMKRNFISKNRSNGIIMMKNCQAEIKQNLISENEAVGLYLRDRCFGEIDSNILNGNEIDVALQKTDDRVKQIQEANTISAEIRTPKQVNCSVF